MVMDGLGLNGMKPAVLACKWLAAACIVMMEGQALPQAWAGDMSSGQGTAQLVRTARVRKHELHETLTISGRWLARSEVSVVSPLEGVRLAEVLVDVGDAVEKGQVMARLDKAQLNAQLNQARQTLLRARADRVDADARLQEAQRAYRRAERLVQGGAISGQDHDAQRARYQSSLAASRGASAAVRGAQAQLRELEIRFSDAEVRAPVSGVVSERLADPGEMVGMQRTLFSLIGGNELEFAGRVPQERLSGVVPGMTARLSVRGQALLRRGVVRVVGRSINQQDGYGEVRIRAEGVGTPTVSEGGSGKAVVDLGQRRVLAVDARALRHGDDADGSGQAYVLVVRDDGRVRRAPVTVGVRDGDWVEVRDGIDEGSTVVLAAAALLKEGDRVEGVQHDQGGESDRQEAKP